MAGASSTTPTPCPPPAAVATAALSASVDRPQKPQVLVNKTSLFWTTYQSCKKKHLSHSTFSQEVFLLKLIKPPLELLEDFPPRLLDFLSSFLGALEALGSKLSFGLIKIGWTFTNRLDGWICCICLIFAFLSFVRRPLSFWDMPDPWNADSFCVHRKWQAKTRPNSLRLTSQSSKSNIPSCDSYRIPARKAKHCKPNIQRFHSKLSKTPPTKNIESTWITSKSTWATLT